MFKVEFNLSGTVSKIAKPARIHLSAGIITRRSLRYFFLLPVVYLYGLLMCVGQFPFTLSSLIGYAPLPASRYRSHEVFQKLWNEIEN
ncbi:unnamed protein product [Trifolium pratense]|uniref:Uncharacterized protein n=1 Tax=Trifolium pratense TaxID=57577 RepID=A0ACB0ME06_TRIPR|nr:unnamed protein product [Trifolium pratense]